MTRDHVHQSRLMHWLLLGRVICFTAVLALTVVGTTALADELAGAEEALKHMNATLSTVESAAKYAKQGKGSETSLHCRLHMQSKRLRRCRWAIHMVARQHRYLRRPLRT